MTTWFGVRPVWILGPLVLYAAALAMLGSEGAIGAVEALFVLGAMGFALPALAFASSGKASRALPPRAPIAPGEISAVLGYLALFAVFVLGFGFTALNSAVPGEPAQTVVKTLVKLATMVLLPVLLLRHYGRERTAWLAPWFSWRLHALPLIVVGAGLLAIQVVFGRGLQTIGALHPSAGTLAWAVPACLAWMTLEAGLCEEVLFRAVLQDRLAAWFGSNAAAVLWGAMLFGLAHAPGLYLRGAASMEGVSEATISWAIAYSIVMIAPVGLAFGVLWARTRNLWLLAVLHGMTDTLPNLAPFIRHFAG
jgi:membrane protease YdiL (CAAX protease family)